MVCFMGIKHKLPYVSKYLTISSIVSCTVVLIYLVVMYLELNQLARADQLVLVRMGSVMLYVPGEMLLSMYVWEIFWLCASLLYLMALRVWMNCVWLHVHLIGYLCAVAFTPLMSFELSMFLVAYFKTLTIYSLLFMQQYIARRDINDRGYEVHQNQFNLVYRRILHISS